MELGGLRIEDREEVRGEDSHLLSVGLCAVCHCCFNQGHTAAGLQQIQEPDLQVRAGLRDSVRSQFGVKYLHREHYYNVHTKAACSQKELKATAATSAVWCHDRPVNCDLIGDSTS